MPFQKGKSGNPNGRPAKGTSLTELLRESVQRCVRIEQNKGRSKTKKVEIRQLMVERLVQKGLEGEEWALRMIFNYLDGVPKQTVALSSSEDMVNPIVAALNKLRGINNKAHPDN